MSGPHVASETADVYVIGSPGGPLKIGRTRNPARRMIGLQNGHPFRLVLLRSTTMSLAEAKEVERRAHWLLRHCRMSGEWFECTTDEASLAVEGALNAVRAETASRGLVRAECRGGESQESRMRRPGFTKIIIALPQSDLQEIDEYRAAERFPSRTAAMIRLIASGLSVEQHEDARIANYA